MIDITRRITKPGVVRVVCDAHPHMLAWMVVHDSPYYAVTDERGAFRIDEHPARQLQGHDVARRLPAPTGVDKDGRPLYDEPRTLAQDVTIAPRATVTIDFELK